MVLACSPAESEVSPELHIPLRPQPKHLKCTVFVLLLIAVLGLQQPSLDVV